MVRLRFRLLRRTTPFPNCRWEVQRLFKAGFGPVSVCRYAQGADRSAACRRCKLKARLAVLALAIILTAFRLLAPRFLAEPAGQVGEVILEANMQKAVGEVLDQ